MDRTKKRVEWFVNLYDYNLSKKDNCEEKIPRVMLRGNIGMDELAEKVQERTGAYKTHEVRAILGIVADLVEECLVDGYAVSTELGTLTPAVTGIWNPERLLPEARAQNHATVNFTHSKRLKETLSDPLFHQKLRPEARPYILSVRNASRGTTDEGFDAGDMLFIKGRLLLMNGDRPERGLYFVDADTGETKACVAPEGMELNTRSQMLVRVPEGLPAGRYRLQVASQCTTGPQPLREAVRSRDERVYCTSSLSSDKPSIEGEDNTTR